MVQSDPDVYKYVLDILLMPFSLCIILHHYLFTKNSDAYEYINIGCLSDVAILRVSFKWTAYQKSQSNIFYTNSTSHKHI